MIDAECRRAQGLVTGHRFHLVVRSYYQNASHSIWLWIYVYIGVDASLTEV